MLPHPVEVTGRDSTLESDRIGGSKLPAVQAHWLRMYGTESSPGRGATGKLEMGRHVPYSSVDG